MNENIENLLDYMEQTITYLEDDGDDWLAGIVQQALTLLKNSLKQRNSK